MVLERDCDAVKLHDYDGVRVLGIVGGDRTC